MYTVSACQTVVVLTCFAVVVDRRSFSVGVQSRDIDGIGSVRDQVVQERIVNISWNQDLFGKEAQALKKCIRILIITRLSLFQ